LGRITDLLHFLPSIIQRYDEDNRYFKIATTSHLFGSGACIDIMQFKVIYG